MMRLRKTTGAALLGGGLALLMGCSNQPAPEPTSTENLVVDYSLFTHCGLDHLKWEGSWFTLQVPERLKGLYSPPKGWEQSQPGKMTVLDNGETLAFTPSGVASLELLYSRDNPQPSDTKWGCG